MASVTRKRQPGSVALACAWRPRGELSRWQALRPQLEDVYQGVTLAVPPDADRDQVKGLEVRLDLAVTIAPRPFWTRHVAIHQALATATEHVTHLHYADGDRLLHWVETAPAEWRRAVEAIPQSEYLIIGRSEQAMRTHPQAMQQTEMIINSVASHLLGEAVDVGGGSRGLSRAAAHLVLAHSVPEHFGDAEWPILLQRCGLSVGYLAVDGLAWETPDHFQAQAASRATQRQVAEAYDQRADRWSARVRTAREIVQEALAATRQPPGGR